MWPVPMHNACASTACSCQTENRATRSATVHGAATKATPATTTPKAVAKHQGANKVVMTAPIPGPIPGVTRDEMPGLTPGPIPDVTLAVTPGPIPDLTPGPISGATRTRPSPAPRKRRARNPAGTVTARKNTARTAAGFRHPDAAPDSRRTHVAQY